MVGHGVLILLYIIIISHLFVSVNCFLKKFYEEWLYIRALNISIYRRINTFIEELTRLRLNLETDVREDR